MSSDRVVVLCHKCGIEEQSHQWFVAIEIEEEPKELRLCSSCYIKVSCNTKELVSQNPYSASYTLLKQSITQVHIVILPVLSQGDTKMKLVTLHVPSTYLHGLEKLVDSNLYPNRSEAIRIAIRDLLKKELWE
ncbi:MAG: type II toxin-antitoxin system ParD family antitoxin [Candidatus Thorarchaeota archaeon]